MTSGTKEQTQVPVLVKRLYGVVRDLESLFPGRHFTPDGHLVGSIGEVLAAHRYGLTLLPASTAGRDATARDGRSVEIKITQGTRIALRRRPDHLIVLKLTPDGHAEEVFNGPGRVAWKVVGKIQKNGQRSVSLGRLAGLMVQVPSNQRLPAVAP